jgi:uncharacterized protein (DUF1697 family)
MPRMRATQIALLRAINVGGTATIGMPALRALLAELGLAEIRTVLQSGNLVFRGDRQSGRELETLLERAAADRLRLSTDVLVRSAAAWTRIVAANPFRDDAMRDPSHLLLMVLKSAPTADSVAALRAAITGPETFHAEGAELYIRYPAGIGRSKLTTRLIETRLGTRGTGRNWNTVLKLAELARPSDH